MNNLKAFAIIFLLLNVAMIATVNGDATSDLKTCCKLYCGCTITLNVGVGLLCTNGLVSAEVQAAIAICKSYNYC